MSEFKEVFELQAPKMAKWKNEAIEALFVFVIVIMTCWKYVFPGELLYGADITAQHFPYFSLMKENGGWPTGWNPYSHCGTPAFANITYAMAYPLNLLSGILEPASMVRLSLIFHIFLYLYGIKHWVSLFLDSKKWVWFGVILAAVQFSLQGMLALGHMILISNLAWMIWVFYFLTLLCIGDGQRWRAFWGLSLSYGLCHLTAGTQFIHQSAFYGILWVLAVRYSQNIPVIKVVLMWGGAFAVGNVISFVQVYETFQYLPHTVRAEYFGSDELLSEGTLGASGLLKWLTPFIWGVPGFYWGQYQFWFAQNYFGFLPVIGICYIFVNRKNKLFNVLMIMIVVSTLAMIGPGTLVYEVQQFVPFSESFRIPVRQIYIAGFFFMPACLLGLRSLMNKMEGKKYLSFGLYIFLSLSLFQLILMLFPSLWKMILAPNVFERVVVEQWELFLVLTFVEIMLLIFIGQVMKIGWSFLIIYISIYSLLIYMLTGEGFPVKSQALEVDKSSISRVYDPQVMTNPNGHMVYGVRSISGYDSFFPKMYRRFLDTLTPQDWSKKTREQTHNLSEMDLKILGCNYLKNGNEPWHKLLPLNQENKRFYLSGKTTWVGREGSPFTKEVRKIQDDIEMGMSTTGFVNGEVQIVEEGLEYVKLSVDAPIECFLASSENTAPLWEAWINGKKADILSWLGTFRAIKLSEGQHVVEFRYNTERFERNFYLSYAVLVMAIISFFYFSIRLRINDVKLLDPN